MAALEALLDGVMARWDVPPVRVVAHSDTAPGRKSDPGPKFDWRRLARGGRAVLPNPDPEPPATEAAFRAAATRAGYGCGDGRAVLDAVRLRFRPWASGALQREDVAIVAGLAEVTHRRA